MDWDPELDVTLSDGRQVATFQIAAVEGLRDAWALIDPWTPRRVIRGCAEALAARQCLDARIAARLAPQRSTTNTRRMRTTGSIRATIGIRFDIGPIPFGDAVGSVHRVEPSFQGERGVDFL